MDRSIEAPSYKVPLLKWWEGVYDHVFIAPYPFYRVRSAEPSPAPLYDRAFDYDERPDHFDDDVKSRGEPMTWATIHAAVAPEVPWRKFCLANWLLSVIGFQERADIGLQKRIDAYCDDHDIYPPGDGALDAIMHPMLHRFLSCFGRRTITAYDEFREHKVELPLSALAADQPTAYIPEGTTNSLIWALHLPEPGILVTSQFDGSEAIIAMTDAAYSIASPDSFMETVTADEETYCDWINPKDFLEREE